jgi:phosphoadenylyl-sulfate reductase (thioredoxin)
MTQIFEKLIKLESGPHPLAGLDAVADRLEGAPPQEILEWAFDSFERSVTIATGFGAEVEAHYGIDIRGFQSALTPETQEQVYGPSLWSADPDLCCRLRKLEPMREALRRREAWITAIRRDQTAARAAARVVEWDYQFKLVKINPLAHWSRRDVWSYIASNGVPYNPLHDQGYPSIGCTHCTRAVGNGEEDRAGRWAGRAKTECGLHAAAPPSDALAPTAAEA